MGRLSLVGSETVDQVRRAPTRPPAGVSVESESVQIREGNGTSLPIQMALLQRQKGGEKHTGYSFSMIAAMT